MGKHFTLDERVIIASSLKERKSFKEIGRLLNKNCTSVSKEIRKHLVIRKTGCFGNSYNACLLRRDCDKSRLCRNPNCKIKKCKNCKICNNFCPEFVEEVCPKLSKPPYVCDGCTKKNRCTVKKQFYSPTVAHEVYKRILSESRNGIAANEAEIQQMDKLISPLIKKGHSLHNICVNNKDRIFFSEKTLYNYMDYNLFSAINLDLPRKVRYRKRKKTAIRKVDRKYISGRTYTDFQSFLKENGQVHIVEIDSVEGKKGGKVLLTIHFTHVQFMLGALDKSLVCRFLIYFFAQFLQENGEHLDI